MSVTVNGRAIPQPLLDDVANVRAAVGLLREKAGASETMLYTQAIDTLATELNVTVDEAHLIVRGARDMGLLRMDVFDADLELVP